MSKLPLKAMQFIIENRPRMLQFLDEVPQRIAISELPHDSQSDEAIGKSLFKITIVIYIL